MPTTTHLYTCGHTHTTQNRPCPCLLAQLTRINNPSAFSPHNRNFLPFDWNHNFYIRPCEHSRILRLRRECRGYLERREREARELWGRYGEGWVRGGVGGGYGFRLW